jgi:hypothetical protein
MIQSTGATVRRKRVRWSRNMNRLAFISLLGGAAVGPLAARAQPAACVSEHGCRYRPSRRPLQLLGDEVFELVHGLGL